MLQLSRSFTFLSLVSVLLLSYCDLPPGAYILNTPLGFSCSTNYDPTALDGEAKATWSSSCSQADKPWLRFIVYVNQADVSGFVFYRNTGLNNEYPFFKDLVEKHIVNDIIIPSEFIVPFIADETCSSKDPNGVDRGQTFPSIYFAAVTQFTNPDYGKGIQGLNTITSSESSVIIPPLPCLGEGTFVVTTVDYINKAESSPSNILTLKS